MRSHGSPAPCLRVDRRTDAPERRMCHFHLVLPALRPFTDTFSPTVYLYIVLFSIFANIFVLEACCAPSALSKRSVYTWLNNCMNGFGSQGKNSCMDVLVIRARACPQLRPSTMHILVKVEFYDRPLSGWLAGNDFLLGCCFRGTLKFVFSLTYHSHADEFDFYLRSTLTWMFNEIHSRLFPCCHILAYFEERFIAQSPTDCWISLL